MDQLTFQIAEFASSLTWDAVSQEARHAAKQRHQPAQGPEDASGPGALPMTGDPPGEPARGPQRAHQADEAEDLAQRPAEQASHREQQHQDQDHPVQPGEAARQFQVR